MSDLKIVVPGTDYLTELSTTQTSIALGASGAFSVANNIATITFTTAHGLTFTPSAGVLPNFFITFSGVTGITGTGTLNGPTFRITAIPSTTTIQIYTTVTAAVMTAATAQLLFLPTFQAALLSANAYYNPNLSSNNFALIGYPLYGSVQGSNIQLAANCNAYYNPDNTNIVQDQGYGATQGTAPTMRFMAVGAGTTATVYSQLRFGGQDYIGTTATAGTTRISIIE